MRRLPLLALALAGATACSGSDDSPARQPAPLCDVHATTGTTAFTRRTAEWGLAGVTGNRLTVADLDGDAFPDLLVHRVYTNQRDDLSAGPRLVRVLMNRPGPAGGRTFVDQTVESGYGATRDGGLGLRSAQLAVAADVDGDGDLDLFSGTYTNPAAVATPPTPADLDRSELLLNDGTGHFTLGPPLEPHASVGMTTSGATFADVDRDGHVDLFVTGWYEYYGFTLDATQPRLHLGNGDGTFREVTADAGLRQGQSGHVAGTNIRPAYGATSCDADADGDVDLLISAYGRQYNQLWLNDGAARFVEVGRETGFAGDENRDYSDNEFFRCWCTLHADEDPLCASAGTPNVQCPAPADSNWSRSDGEGWRLNGNTFTTVCADVTGDGLADLYNAEIHHWWAGQSSDGSTLLVGDLGSGALRHQRPDREAVGLGWPRPTPDWNEGGIVAAAHDIDLDGRTEVLVGASDYPDQYALAFVQQADGTFREEAAALGLEHACASGMAVADFDRDGDLDVIFGSSTARDCAEHWTDNEVHLYESDASQRGAWLEVSLRDAPGSNGAAIGARVTVTAGGVTQTREVQGGYGHFGMQADTTQHFGLGACEAADVEVTWPDGARTSTRLPAVAARQRVEVRP